MFLEYSLAVVVEHGRASVLCTQKKGPMVHLFLAQRAVEQPRGCPYHIYYIATSQQRRRGCRNRKLLRQIKER